MAGSVVMSKMFSNLLKEGDHIERTKRIIIRLTKNEMELLQEMSQESSDSGKSQRSNVSEYIRKCVFEQSCQPKELKEELRKLSQQVRKARMQTDLIAKKAEQDKSISVFDIEKMTYALDTMETVFSNYKTRLEELYGNHEAHAHQGG